MKICSTLLIPKPPDLESGVPDSPSGLPDSLSEVPDSPSGVPDLLPGVPDSSPDLHYELAGASNFEEKCIKMA